MKYLLILLVLVTGCVKDPLITIKQEYQSCYVKELNTTETIQEFGIWCNQCTQEEHYIVGTWFDSLEGLTLRIKKANRSCFIFEHESSVLPIVNKICNPQLLNECFQNPPDITIIYSKGKQIIKANRFEKK